MRILLAEDDANIAKIAKITLEKIGRHNVVVVNDGKRTLEIALKEDFDLILLDGMLPSMDGNTILKNLKESTKAHLPVIFLSAKSQEADIKTVLENGAVGFIQKPFEPRTLCQQIEEMLRKAA